MDEEGVYLYQVERMAGGNVQAVRAYPEEGKPRASCPGWVTIATGIRTLREALRYGRA
jgi:hypothetical protein